MATTQEHQLSILGNLPSYWATEADTATAQLVNAFSEQFSEFDTEKENLHLELYVTTATGSRLDDIGKIFKLYRRGGETDDQYRARLMAFYPGYGAGGTIPALKNIIYKITGVPESQVEIIEDIPPLMKFKATITLILPEHFALIDTFKDIIWQTKAAGVYPFFIIVLDGSYIADTLAITESVDIQYITTLSWFIWEVSVIDGTKLIW